MPTAPDYRKLYCEHIETDSVGGLTITLEGSANGDKPGRQFILEPNGVLEPRNVALGFKPSLAPYRYFLEDDRAKIVAAFLNVVCPRDGGASLTWAGTIIDGLERQKLLKKPEDVRAA